MGNAATPPPRTPVVDVGDAAGFAPECGAPFFTRLDQVLETADFDGSVERQCQRFYATLRVSSLATSRSDAFAVDSSGVSTHLGNRGS
jgi:hypothetical protein